MSCNHVWIIFSSKDSAIILQSNSHHSIKNIYTHYSMNIARNEYNASFPKNTPTFQFAVSHVADYQLCRNKSCKVWIHPFKARYRLSSIGTQPSCRNAVARGSGVDGECSRRLWRRHRSSLGKRNCSIYCYRNNLWIHDRRLTCIHSQHANQICSRLTSTR